MDNTEDEAGTTIETDEDTGAAVSEAQLRAKSAKPWMSMIKRARKHFQQYNDKMDAIDKVYASLDRLASIGRDREFQIFWANVQTTLPSIYSKSPIPVVVPRHRDRRPLYRTASELLERAIGTEFDLSDINETMLLVRDDLVIGARGVPWVRVEREDGRKKVCMDHLDRTDFMHDPVRYWKDCDWVARRGWMTKGEMRKRFRKSSGEEYLKAAYTQMKNTDIDSQSDSADMLSKAGVWELWSKSQDKVVWVAEGCEKCLDEGEPDFDVKDFFPCPKPAYGTTQRRSTIPVPDYLLYKDQIEEINDVTARIASISESLRVKGFFPSSMGDIGDAIQAALLSTDDRAVLIPIANWAAFGEGVSPKDMIVWLPLADIAATVQQLIEFRKQLIDDVYQITGMSDIMRGSTEASETATAQQLKANYGSVRIRDRQQEMVRVAAALVSITGEIMAEEYTGEEMLLLSQMELPTDKDVEDQVKPLQAQLDQLTKMVGEAQAKAKSDPQIQAHLQTPEGQQQQQQMLGQANQQAQQLGQQIAALKDKPTIDGVMKLLRDEKLRPFALDIETDSTIAADENADKQQATEYLTAMGGLIGQAIPALEAPGVGKMIAPLIGETIRFAQARFRVGRQMDQVVDEFVQKIQNMPDAPQGPTPEQQAEQAKQQADQHKQALEQQDAQVSSQERMVAAQERAGKEQRAQAEHGQELAHKQQLNEIELEIKRGDVVLRDLDRQIKEIQLSGAQVEVRGKQLDTSAKMAGGGMELGEDGETAQPLGTRDNAIVEEGMMLAHDKLDHLVKKVSGKKRLVKDPVSGEPQGIADEDGEVRPFDKDPMTGEIVGV